MKQPGTRSRQLPSRRPSSLRPGRDRCSSSVPPSRSLRDPGGPRRPAPRGPSIDIRRNLRANGQLLSDLPLPTRYSQRQRWDDGRVRIDPQAVYAAVRAIPEGTVITYGELAERLGLNRNHARAIGNVLRGHPENDAWMTTPSEDHDIPWWRVVKADGSLLALEDESNRVWVDWARSVLVSEGVPFTDDGRVASVAGPRQSARRSDGARSASTGRARVPEPCWRHDKVQYTCRDCAPAGT